jgi:hypothetical protein
MSKTLIITAAVSALVIATPAFAQDRGDPAGGQSAGFGGLNGSATNLRDAPRPGDETQSTGFGGRNTGGSATGDAIKREIRSSRVVEPRQTRDRPARHQATNNMKQVGLANH